ncbi:hypothetical protein SJ05684_a39100 (plasmid) [Sinorhizobium sojae CCBAU 05684]|uniref:Uncharacterized protein n=1 Tax=Sinorhizobium sojae CCBAU 05684 TaxID=716928 RepID=A0A249PNI4_9HYPH|nr:hypothetical protein SJ05684_a39100 [Sinorhizobium sojae CCBAU 05684]AWI61926.1 hypothetical protein AB395_00004401 [Sinorhizobium fredii CCBAU 45436]AWM29852.1 hypothetical protein AOX55_00004416 [Sinorhizobium fredii CCBAU 25509]
MGTFGLIWSATLRTAGWRLGLAPLRKSTGGKQKLGRSR